MLKCSGSIIWRLGTRATIRKYSSPGASVAKDKLEMNRNIVEKASQPPLDSKETSGLVAAAFASLNSPDDEIKRPSPKSVKQSRTQVIDTQILKASDVNSLLVVAESAVISRRHALKMVSILSEWSTCNKVKLSDFEKDPRFLKLCRILARTPATQAMSSITMAEDLSTVLGITGDDEAARLISNLTVPQMVKVMKALHQKGRRSTPLLRALSHNLVRQSELIDLKKSADLLFSMASLNFPDPVLLDRICHDIIECLPSLEDKPAVINSITVSLGLLRYRHEEVLSALAGWMREHSAVCRAGDVASAVVTFATLDFVPPEGEQLLQTALSLKEDEMIKSSVWLDLVFSLLTLDKAETHHLVSVLHPEFIEKLLSSGVASREKSARRLYEAFVGHLPKIPIPSRRKLMMIDAYAATVAPSATPRLADDISVGVPVVYTKEKQLYVQSIMDTFKSLVSAESFLKRDCNSGMGFLYDAEFAVDNKCHPVPLEKAAKIKGIHRIAVLGLDYHDMTRRVVAPLGINQFYTKLLQLKGYRVLQIPYTEYNPKDKLVTRVQYIEKRLKEIVSSSPAS